MSEDKEEDLEPLKYIEHQCEAQIEAQPDYETQLGLEREAATQRMWAAFHNSAAAIAHLYRERSQGNSLWLPFQTAAGTVTALYKDSNETLRRMSDLGLQAGHQRRTKELLGWARRRRHLIRRDELIAFLAGRTVTGRPHRASPRPKMLHEGQPISNPPEDNLNTFREALTLSGATRRRSSPTQGLHELSSFISSEFARHCKRPAATSPTHDVNMDSPTHKRSRLM